MSKRNEQKVQAAKDAIQAVFKDMSVSQDITRTNLKDIRDEIDELLSTLTD